ncbi:MAG: hypothetical protein PHF57_12370 [Methanoregula sp.]|nr:hypothetical protein [Methanoregula sp.]
MNRIHTKILIFFVVVCILITSGCVSQNKTGNTSGISANATDPTLVQTPCPPTSGNTTPYIIIDPIATHNVGDVFEITGTTNLGVDTEIFLSLLEPMLWKMSWDETDIRNYQYSGSSGYVKVQNGACGTNFWSFPINLSGYFNPYSYTVDIEQESNHSVQNRTIFFLNLDRSKILYPVSPPMQEYVTLYKVTAAQKNDSHADKIENDSEVYNRGDILEFYLKNKGCEMLMCANTPPSSWITYQNEDNSWTYITGLREKVSPRISHLMPRESTRVQRLNTTDWNPGRYRIVFDCSVSREFELQ